MGIIGSIRKHSGWAVAIVGIAILAFILGDLTKNKSGIPDVGKVNGTTLTSQRWNELLTEAENSYKVQYQTAQIPSDAEMMLRNQVWQQFVDQTLIDAETQKLGLQVTAAELNDMYVGTFIHPFIRQSFTDPQTGVFDIKQVNYWIENFSTIDTARRQQWVELEKAVRTDREQQKYATLLSAGFYMPKAVSNKIAELGNEASNVRVVALSYNEMADTQVELTDADYKKYYDEHRNEFRIREESRALEFITFPVRPTSEDLAAIEDEVKKVWADFQTTDDSEMAFFVGAESDRPYDSSYVRANSFRAPLDERIAAASAGTMIEPTMVGNEWVMAKVMATAVRPDSLRASVVYVLNSQAGGGITRSNEQAKQLADSLLTQINAKKLSFEDAVRLYSDDPQKEQTQGDMEWQRDGGYGFLNEQIVNTPVGGCFLFEHPQGVGYFVVKVTDKTPAEKKYRVALISREIVPSNNTNRMVYNDANRFAGQNRTVEAFEAAAREQNLQVRSANTFMMDDRLSGIANARSIVQWAYNEDTKIGAVADQVFECDGMFIVVALKDIYRKGYATLDQVRPSIERQVRLDKVGDMLMSRAEAAVKGGKDIASIATALQSPVDTLNGVAFGDYNLQKFGMEPKVISAIASTPSGLVGPVKGANGVYIVQVDSKEPHTSAATDVNRMVQMYQYKATRDARGQWTVGQVLRDAAKIKDQRNKFF